MPKPREFSYSAGRGNTLTVAVNSNTYDKRISFVLQLVEELRASIPFPFTVESEPEVHILGGIRVKGKLSVEMSIILGIDRDEAVNQLRGKGYTEGLEFTLG